MLLSSLSVVVKALLFLFLQLAFSQDIAPSTVLGNGVTTSTSPSGEISYKVPVASNWDLHFRDLPPGTAGFGIRINGSKAFNLTTEKNLYMTLLEVMENIYNTIPDSKAPILDYTLRFPGDDQPTYVFSASGPGREKGDLQIIGSYMVLFTRLLGQFSQTWQRADFVCFFYVLDSQTQQVNEVDVAVGRWNALDVGGAGYGSPTKGTTEGVQFS